MYSGKATRTSLLGMVWTLSSGRVDVMQASHQLCSLSHLVKGCNAAKKPSEAPSALQTSLRKVMGNMENNGIEWNFIIYNCNFTMVYQVGYLAGGERATNPK